MIRKRAAAGGILLTASHNPGGPSGDFGVKVDVANGGPAPEGVTEAIFVASRRIARYRTLEAEDIDLDRLGPTRLGPAAVEVFDPVADYADLMETLFDFGAISWLFPAAGFRMRYDAMHAVNGPYAHELLARRLGGAILAQISWRSAAKAWKRSCDRIGGDMAATTTRDTTTRAWTLKRPTS